AAGADIGHAHASDGAEAVFSRWQNAAEQQVADFRRGEVDDADERAGIDELLHRLPAYAGGVKHKALEILFQRVDHGVDAGGGHAEHSQPDRRLATAARCRLALALDIGGACSHHADDRGRAVAEDLARYGIETRNVGDRIEHHDV